MSRAGGHERGGRWRPGDGRLRRATVLFTMLAPLVSSACLSADPSPRSPAELGALAEAVQWPGSHVPTGQDLVRFSEQAVTADDDPVAIVGWANACAWYGAWLRDFRNDGRVDERLLSHLEEQLPSLPFLQGIAGGQDAFEALARDAAEGRSEPIERFVTLNRCDVLQTGGG